MSSHCTIILAAGGTGGHLFPAVALGEALTERGYQPVLLTDQRTTHYLHTKGESSALPYHVIPAATPKGNVFAKVHAAIHIGMGIVKARNLLKNLQPKAVIGFGGYPAFTTMVAALSCGIPTIIHEQNSVCGRVNSLLSRYVKAIATAFPHVAKIRENDQHKVVLTGNPVRAAIRALWDSPYPALTQESVLSILVLGGSQGAGIFSQVLPEAIALLPESMRKRLRITQQCRKDDLENTQAAYEKLQINAELAPFFTDIPARLAASQLVISRAGASSLAEITIAGRPSILVPYPHATDNHQMTNALSLKKAGAAWVIPQEDFTAENLADRLREILTAPETLEKMAQAAKSAALPDAVERLVACVEKLA